MVNENETRRWNPSPQLCTVLCALAWVPASHPHGSLPQFPFCELLQAYTICILHFVERLLTLIIFTTMITTKLQYCHYCNNYNNYNNNHHHLPKYFNFFLNSPIRPAGQVCALCIPTVKFRALLTEGLKIIK